MTTARLYLFLFYLLDPYLAAFQTNSEDNDNGPFAEENKDLTTNLHKASFSAYKIIFILIDK